MNLVYENQTIYGFSQQEFGFQPSGTVQFQSINATLGANDHLAIVKADGSWKNHKASNANQNIDDMKSEEIPFTRVESAQLYSKLFSLFAWSKPLKFVELWEQA